MNMNKNLNITIKNQIPKTTYDNNLNNEKTEHIDSKKLTSWA